MTTYHPNWNIGELSQDNVSTVGCLWQTGTCGRALDNTQDPDGGSRDCGAHNATWGGKEDFLEVVMLQLSLEEENQISVTI